MDKPETFTDEFRKVKNFMYKKWSKDEDQKSISEEEHS